MSQFEEVMEHEGWRFVITSEEELRDIVPAEAQTQEIGQEVTVDCSVDGEFRNDREDFDEIDVTSMDDLITINPMDFQDNVNSQNDQVETMETVEKETEEQILPTKVTPPVKVRRVQRKVQISTSLLNPPPGPHNFVFSNTLRRIEPNRVIVATSSSLSNDLAQQPIEPFRLEALKPCHCTKSNCLKLYCDCFANGHFCGATCTCTGCSNNLRHEQTRHTAIQNILSRNSSAFRPKVVSIAGEHAHARRHHTGCNCRKSKCLKNYCECFQAKIFCSELCKCTECHNNCSDNIGKSLEEHFRVGRGHTQSLTDLANAAVVRQQQQHQVKERMNQMEDGLSHRNLGVIVPPVVFKSHRQTMSFDFISSMVQLLLVKAEAAEIGGQGQSDVERTILSEFGDCLEGYMKIGKATSNYRT